MPQVPKSLQEGYTGYLVRLLPQFRNPEWATAQQWRAFVYNNPLMMAIIEVITSQVVALPWKVLPVDPNLSGELADEVDYYTDILNLWDGESFDVGVERLLFDMFTIPFGGAVELGRFRDGTLAWIRSIDGGTCYPTLDPNYPVAQRFPYMASVGPPDDRRRRKGYDILYPDQNVARAYIGARAEFDRRGWGMAPPERVYLAALLIAYGDRYYWQFFLDTPEVGVLDLADMSRESAERWLESMRSLLGGVDPYKIGVLYEHEKPVEFISFKRAPHEVQFAEGMEWYAHLCAAAFGVALSEVGLGGKKTLAGEIRADRRTRRTGLGRAVEKVVNVVRRMLPDYLTFSFENRDDEGLALLGRARATTITAMRQAIEAGIMTPEQAFAQLVRDGLLSGDVVGPFAGGAPQRTRPVQRKEMQDERVVPPDEGGLGVVKEITERALSSCWEYRRIVLGLSHGDVTDLGNRLYWSCMYMALGREYDEAIGIEEDVWRLAEYFVNRANVPELDGMLKPVVVGTVLRYMSFPWARRSLESAHLPAFLRGRTIHNKLLRELAGVIGSHGVYYAENAHKAKEIVGGDNGQARD